MASTNALAAARLNLRLAIDNKWNAVKQLETLEKRLRKAGDPQLADRVANIHRELAHLPV